jgi:hypothetical protein
VAGVLLDLPLQIIDRVGVWYRLRADLVFRDDFEN